jgi:sugar phosphate isomerase/epimerase
MQIALNTIAFEPARWDADKSAARPLEDILPLIARAGYPACEVWQHHLTNRSPDALPSFRDAAARLGLRFAAVGGYPSLHEEGPTREEQRRLMARLMNACEALGAPIIKVFAGRIASGRIEPDQRLRSMDFLREALDQAAARRLTFTVETHGNTLADTPDAAESLRRDLAAGNLKFCFQPFDLKDAGRVLPDYERLRPHVAHVHLQGRDAQGFSLLRDSLIDYGGLLRRLKRDGFDGLLSVEFVKDCHPKARADYSDDRVAANAAADLAFIREAWR